MKTLLTFLSQEAKQNGETARLPQKPQDRLRQSTEHLSQEQSGTDRMGGMEKIPHTSEGRA